MRLDDAKEHARRVDLISLVESRGFDLRRESAKEMRSACPRCPGSTDSFHVNRDFWFCRKCYDLNNGQPHDAAAFLMWMDGVTFVEALKALCNVTDLEGGSDRPRERRQPEPPSRIAKDAKPVSIDADWQASATRQLEAAKAALAPPSAGAEYLRSRGLTMETARAFGLGFEQAAWVRTRNEKAPAVVMPWFSRGQLCGLRYRFIGRHEELDEAGNIVTGDDGKPKLIRLSMLKGSTLTGCLFGSHVLPFPGPAPEGCTDILARRTIVLVEGEINAMSIYQTAHAWKWDVLSIGAQDSKIAPAAADYIRRYGCIISWMDEARIAEQFAQTFDGSLAAKSPVIDGKKADANDMLQRGELAAFLASLRLRGCKTQAERKAFYFDLVDADANDGLWGVDADVLEMAKREASK